MGLATSEQWDEATEMTYVRLFSIKGRISLIGHKLRRSRSPGTLADMPLKYIQFNLTYSST